MTDGLVLRFLAAPGEETPDGTSIQAGKVMEWIDRAGYGCAVGHSDSYCVTAYVGDVHFSRPIPPGSLVEVEARLVHTGLTSMHVLVSVDAANPREPSYIRATSCLMVFVAVGSDGSPQEVPSWSPRISSEASPEVDAERLAHAALSRIPARRAIHDLMRAQQYTAEGTGPRVVLRFLAAPTDANWGGNAHGGTVMRWIDEAARTCATGWARADAVAVYAGGIHFYRPIHIGHLVEVEARLIHTSPRSMHVAVHVRSADPRTGAWALTTQCLSVLVVLGADGRAQQVPDLPLTSAEDASLDSYARALIAARAQMPPLPVRAGHREHR